MDKKMMIFMVGLGICIMLLITAVVLEKHARNKCDYACDDLGAIIYQIIPNGAWNSNDYCICYFEDYVRTIQLG